MKAEAALFGVIIFWIVAVIVSALSWWYVAGTLWVWLAVGLFGLKALTGTQVIAVASAIVGISNLQTTTLLNDADAEKSKNPVAYFCGGMLGLMLVFAVVGGLSGCGEAGARPGGRGASSAPPVMELTRIGAPRRLPNSSIPVSTSPRSISGKPICAPYSAARRK